MIGCKEVDGKVIQLCTLYEDDNEDPEVQIDFTDGASFTVSLKARVSLEAKSLLDEGWRAKDPKGVHRFRRSAWTVPTRRQTPLNHSKASRRD
jgi:hypothetical protein